MRNLANIRLHIEICRNNTDSVFSPSEMTPEMLNLVKASEISALKSYDEAMHTFYSQGVTYTRQMLLKSVSQEWQMNVPMQINEILKTIISVANTLLFTEVEIVYWSLLLKNKSPNIRPALYAYFTGFQAKLSLNSDIIPFEQCLNSIIPNFKLHFNNWQLISDFPNEISISDINKKFKQLCEMRKTGLKDYEAMVQELMQIPRRKESIMSESLLSDISLEHGEAELEEFEIDLLQEAKLSPIDRFED